MLHVPKFTVCCCGECTSQLAEHKCCSQQPADVKLESFVRKVDKHHIREMAAVREELARQISSGSRGFQLKPLLL